MSVIPYLHLAAAAIATASLVPTASALWQRDGAYLTRPVVEPSYCIRAPLQVESDGSVYVSFGWGDGLSGFARLGPDGALRPSWGESGLNRVESPDFASAQHFIPAADGGVFVVLQGFLGARVLRLDRSGRPVASYGGGDGISEFAPNASLDSLALAADGSLVAALGYLHLADRASFVRFDPQGKIDRSFGVNGVYTVPVVLNRIISMGNSTRATVFAWGVDRHSRVQLAYYILDAQGGVLPALHQESTGSSVPPGRLLPHDVVASWQSPLARVQPDGGLLLAQGRNIWRFGPDGRIDTAFGDGGRVALQKGGATALFTAPGGRTTVFSYLEEGPAGWGGASLRSASAYVSRLRPDGELDAAFPNGTALGGWQLTSWNLASDGSLFVEAPTTGCAVARLASSEAPRADAVVVEYHHPLLDHYFMTAEGEETAVLDNNVELMGWIRTGHTFGAWQNVDLPGTDPVCRFYGDLVAGPNSHFFTSERFECEMLRQIEARTPRGEAAWRLEAMPIRVVAAVDGTCPGNLQPVFRLYNRGFEQGGVANHRYTTQTAVYEEMVSKGWAPEGVRFCVPHSLGSGSFRNN